MCAARADETDVVVLKALTFSRLALTEKLFIMKQGGPALSLQQSKLLKENSYDYLYLFVSNNSSKWIFSFQPQQAKQGGGPDTF